MLDTANAPPHYLPVTPETLRAALDEKGIETQSQAATLLGVSEAAVSLWLNGLRPIPRMATMALRSVSKRTVQDTPKPKKGRPRNSKNKKG